MQSKRILIIGEVYIDTHLDKVDPSGPLVRLGGIFHSARGFSALGVEFALAYYAPDYLEDDINLFSLKLNTVGVYKLGKINKAPNVMLINDSKELIYQGYYNVVKDQAEFIEIDNLSEIINKVKPTDILVNPGRYDLQNIMSKLKDFSGKIHIDFHYDSEMLLNDKLDIETAIISTSSDLFKNDCKSNFNGVIEFFSKHNVNSIIVKENRGGSYCYLTGENKKVDTPAYYVKTMHSVGVGDVFNSVFISPVYEGDIPKKMKCSSLFAAKYAETMDFDKFKQNINNFLKNIDELISLEGTRLSWEDRATKNIYIAAPDFPYIDTKILDNLGECLKNHNFNPRFPIREHGLANREMSIDEELCLYKKDNELLHKCDLLIAVLLYNDPGTLVELGMFKQSGKPTIIFDPYNYCENIFVKNTPNFLCKNIEDVLNATYDCLKRKNNG